MLVLLHQTLHQHGPRPIVLEELLHLCGQLLCRVTPDRMHTHRLCKEDEVGVLHLRVRVALVVEEI